MKSIQSVRGMNDLFGEEAQRFIFLVQQIDLLFGHYQFEPIMLPLVEKTELFARGIGDATDIVEKEMYTFTDRNNESLSLRPEATAGCVRACLEHGLIHNQIRKLWYVGPMFRHERPQKGRYRQFYQVGAEVFGLSTPDIEAETLSMLYALWQKMGIAEDVTLEINTIGTAAERKAFRQALFDFLSPKQDQLDSDSQRRLETNPLRILDSKVPATQALLIDAPKLTDFLAPTSLAHFQTLKAYLTALDIPFRENPNLVRGLDYYAHTVFEWTTPLLGAQATVCGGGRYDGLVTQLGGQATPAFGFAMGVERLLLLAQQKNFGAPEKKPDIYLMVPAGKEADVLHLAQKLRAAGYIVASSLGGGSEKSQSKRAAKSGARIILSELKPYAEIMLDLNAI